MMATSLIPAPGEGHGVGRYDGNFFNPSTWWGGGAKAGCELSVNLLFTMSSRPARAI